MLLLGWACLLSVWFLPNIVKSSNQCPVQGQTAPTQNGMHNFIIDTFTGGTFPFAINQCTAVSIPAAKWYKYTCSQQNNTNQWAVVKTSYSDSSCSGTGKVVRTFYYNETNSTNYFECDGVNSYAEIGISVSSDCSSSVTIYAGLTGCATAGNSQFEFYCNNSVAFVEFFNSAALNQTNVTMSTTGAPMSTTGAPMSTTGSLMSTTGAPMSTTALTATTSGVNVTGTSLNQTHSSTGLSSSTGVPFTTGLLATLLSTVIPSSTMGSAMSSTMGPTELQQTCNTNDYCEVWILPSGKCTFANTSAFRSFQVKIYGQLLKCNDNSTGGSSSSTTTMQPSASVRLQVAITAIFTLLLAISWI